MKICELHVECFRGIGEATLFFPDHEVLVGDNNVGKSTILEAIDLVLVAGQVAMSATRGSCKK